MYAGDMHARAYRTFLEAHLGAPSERCDALSRDPSRADAARRCVSMDGCLERLARDLPSLRRAARDGPDF